MAAARPRVVMWSHLPPAGGGLTRVARNLAADPTLAERFSVEFRGTHEAAAERVGRFHVHNVWRALRDSVSMFAQVRGARVVEVFSSGHTSTVLLRGILLSLAARLAGARVLFYLGSGRLYPEDPRDFRPTRGMPTLFRVLGALVSAFVIIDENARPVLAPMVGQARIEMIPPPLDDPGEVTRDPGGPPTLVHVGRITKEKGIPELLEACRLLDERGTEGWRLRLIGPLERSTPGELEAIEAAAEALGERVTFVGWLDDVGPELADADVFVSASHREGLPGSVAEACAYGRPVVATRVGATSSLVRDGVNGFLVPPGDPAALADAIGKLLGDAGLRAEMGEEGRRWVLARYGREQVAARYTELLADLV